MNCSHVRKGDIIEAAVAIFIAALFILVLYLLISGTGKKNLSPREQGQDHPARDTISRKKPEKHCPLCGSLLEPNEKVHSVLYPGKTDRITEVYGCPHCYPAKAESPRKCPVCRGILPPDGCVIGRMSEQADKKHLHILGCTVCRKLYSQK